MSDNFDYSPWLRQLADIAEDDPRKVNPCPKALRRAADALEQEDRTIAAMEAVMSLLGKHLNVTPGDVPALLEAVGRLPAGGRNPLMDVILEDLEENDVDPADVFGSDGDTVRCVDCDQDVTDLQAHCEREDNIGLIHAKKCNHMWVDGTKAGEDGIVSLCLYCNELEPQTVPDTDT